MEKKGFTLIELLAVIVVLAVIALITVPTILGVIEKTRKNSLLDSAYGLIESANLYAAQYGMNSVSRFDIENGIQTSSKKLSYKGKVENGTILINTSGEVTVCVNSKNYSAYKNYKDSKVTLVDNKNCTWNELSNQVYLDGEKTIDEYTNQELTELVTSLQGEITLLKDKSYGKTEVDNLVSDLNEKIEQINTKIIENNNNQAMINNNLQSAIDEISTNLSGAGTIKYNENDDFFYVNVAGNWVKTAIKAYAKTTLLYNYGTFYEGFGFNKYAYLASVSGQTDAASPTFSANTNNIQVNMQWGRGGSLFSKSKYNLTNVSKIKIVATNTSFTEYFIGVTQSLSNRYSFNAYKSITPGITEYELDVSSLSGEYYLVVFAASHTTSAQTGYIHYL